MNIPAPTKEHEGFKYYLATKSCDSKEWSFCIQPFVLTVTNHVVGQFITTLWYNQLCTGANWYCEVAIVRVATGAQPEEFKAVKSIMNGLAALGQGYDDYDGAVLHGVFDSDMYKKSYVKIVEKLGKPIEENKDRAVSVCSELNMTTRGMITMTVQGSYTQDGTCVTTLTLPVFQIENAAI